MPIDRKVLKEFTITVVLRQSKTWRLWDPDDHSVQIASGPAQNGPETTTSGGHSLCDQPSRVGRLTPFFTLACRSTETLTLEQVLH